METLKRERLAQPIVVSNRNTVRQLAYGKGELDF
jgi:hypothetical protein